jgi:hypothetical protein
MVLKICPKGHMSFKSSNTRSRCCRVARPQREKGCANFQGSTMFLAPNASEARPVSESFGRAFSDHPER